MTQRSSGFIGRLLASRYRIIARLGEGAISQVYLARHVLIDRLSAIKVVAPQLAHDRSLREQFLHEARAVNRIHHPNIVEITDYGETEDTAFLVMEYVPGDSLQRLLNEGAWGAQRSAQLGLKLALALGRAHEMGVIHCDIRPSNILVAPGAQDDVVKLTDFGAAKLSKFTPDSRHHEASPPYLAPEGSGSEQADLYALGVILYECISGRLPHDAALPIQHRHAAESLLGLGLGVSAALDRVVMSLLSLDPSKRPRDAYELAAALRSAAEEFESAPTSVPIPLTIREPAPRRSSEAGRMLTMPFDQIAAICMRAFAKLGPVAEKDRHAQSQECLQKAQGLMVMVERLAELVRRDTEEIAVAESEAARLRDERGAHLDALGRQRSQALGWAVVAADESDRVRSQRLSGTQRTSHADALLWEEATLDQEEDRSMREAAEMGAEIVARSQALKDENERLDHQHDVLAARLEGHVAALRALASETWQALERLAEVCDVAVVPE